MHPRGCGGLLYLAVVLDTWNHRIVGAAMRRNSGRLCGAPPACQAANPRTGQASSCRRAAGRSRGTPGCQGILGPCQAHALPGALAAAGAAALLEHLDKPS